MCGIAGVFSVSRRDEARRVVEAVVRSQTNRGPDNQQLQTISGSKATVILAHNRLSIIDLTESANQPMWDATNRFGIVFNGEIYNYIELRSELVELGRTFRTRSDTEVILEAFSTWGIDAVRRFNGMFAFAVFDRQEQTLWLVRDRFGVKPLYMYQDGSDLYFASTETAIADEFLLRPNLNYLARGLRYWIYEDGSDDSPYVGLKALQPGHYCRVSILGDGRCTASSSPYYSLYERVTELRETLADRPIPEMVEQVDSLLHSAIELRLRTDVPVGVSLSGGLDSSLVSAVAARHHGKLIAFTYGHPECETTEGPLVQRLTETVPLEVHYVFPDNSVIQQALIDTLRAQGAPFPGGSIIAQHLVFQKVRSTGVRVLLGGQGADEAFMGYRKYFWFYLKRLAFQKQYYALSSLAVGLIPMLLAERGNVATLWTSSRRYVRDPKAETSLLQLPTSENYEIGYDPSRPLWQRQIDDITCYSLPTLLRYEDRNSMGCSVESRLPFLDYRLVELAVALPEAMKLRMGYGKWLLRQVARPMVPNEIWAARNKRGFDVDQKVWLHGGLGQAIRTWLHERRVESSPWVSGHLDINKAFSDSRLEEPKVFTEACTLIWLGEQGGARRREGAPC